MVKKVADKKLTFGEARKLLQGASSLAAKPQKEGKMQAQVESPLSGRESRSRARESVSPLREK
jgi:hypothetical protein